MVSIVNKYKTKISFTGLDVNISSRLINSRKHIVTKSQINIGKYYDDLIKKSQDYLKDSTIPADKRLNVFQISSVIAILTDKKDTDVARDINSKNNEDINARVGTTAP